MIIRSVLGRTPRVLGWLVVTAGLVAVLLAAGTAARRLTSLGWLGGRTEPTITHALVVERIREVAKLVSTEMTIRDVVIYEHTQFASTKRALLVVTGKVLAGIDLQRKADVKIDHLGRTITITLPPARILAVDVLSVRTYDERAGLLNPFRPEDRDLIQHRTRMQLVAAGRQSGILDHADRSARALLQTLFGRDGYTVVVAPADAPTDAPSDAPADAPAT